MKRLNYFIPLFLLGIFFFNTSSSQTAFMKLGDIKGESTDASHKDWIIIQSISQGITKPSGAGTGAARRRGSAEMQDFVITKKLDISSPKLMESITKGLVIPEVIIELVQPNRKPYYTIILNNVMITKVLNSGNCPTQCEVTEEVSLNFEKIKWTYNDAKGSSTAAFNVETNK